MQCVCNIIYYTHVPRYAKSFFLIMYHELLCVVRSACPVCLTVFLHVNGGPHKYLSRIIGPISVSGAVSYGNRLAGTSSMNKKYYSGLVARTMSPKSRSMLTSPTVGLKSRSCNVFRHRALAGASRRSSRPTRPAPRSPRTATVCSWRAETLVASFKPRDSE